MQIITFLTCLSRALSSILQLTWRRNCLRTSSARGSRSEPCRICSRHTCPPPASSGRRPGRTASLQTAIHINVAHTRLPSLGFRSYSRFLAVSLQVTWVINPAVGCYYFLPGLQLPPQEGCYQFCCLVNRGTMGVSSLPKTVTRQRRGCDLNPGLLRPSPAC